MWGWGWDMQQCARRFGERAVGGGIPNFKNLNFLNFFLIVLLLSTTLSQLYGVHVCIMAARSRNAIYAAGVVALGGAFAILPLYFGAHVNRNLSTSETPLSGQAVMRGPYINSGSVDVGADPDWVVTPGHGRVFVGNNRSALTDDQIARFRGELAAKRELKAADAASAGASTSGR